MNDRLFAILMAAADLGPADDSGCLGSQVKRALWLFAATAILTIGVLGLAVFLFMAIMALVLK